MAIINADRRHDWDAPTALMPTTKTAIIKVTKLTRHATYTSHDRLEPNEHAATVNLAAANSETVTVHFSADGLQR